MGKICFPEGLQKVSFFWQNTNDEPKQMDVPVCKMLIFYQHSTFSSVHHLGLFTQVTWSKRLGEPKKFLTKKTHVEQHKVHPSYDPPTGHALDFPETRAGILIDGKIKQKMFPRND